MSKKLSPEKLTLGIRKEFRKEKPNGSNDIESIVHQIHSNKAQSEEETKRTTLDIPKSLHKKISRQALEKDLTLKDYFIGLAKMDIGIE